MLRSFPMLRTRRTQGLAACLGLLVGLGLLDGCAQTAATPAEKLRLLVKAPSDADNPFVASADGAFIAITAEGPAIAADKYQVVLPYKPGMAMSLPDLPFGLHRQVRVEVWSRDPATGTPAPPILGRGRSMPIDVSREGASVTVHPYVTKINRFAPASDDQGVTAKLEGRTGASSVALPNGQALIIGGGTLSGTAKNPYDPSSYLKFSETLVAYDPDSRQVVTPGNQADPVTLKTPRALQGSAMGLNVVAIVGGVTLDGGAVKPTKSIEYYDIHSGGVQTSAAGTPDLVFARAQPTVVQMFENDNYFLILGGKGDTPCTDAGADVPCAANTWEIWHPVYGNVAQAALNEARWNHAAVRLPAQDGGYVMLIGGENDTGVLSTFEVIQFNTAPTVSHKGFACSDPPPSDGRCQVGESDPRWQPMTGYLPGGAGRTQLGALFLSTAKYNFVYMIGGFTDKAHKNPSNRVDIFDIATGVYVDAGADYALAGARGAAMVAAAQTTTHPGQVLVAGGSLTETSHLDSAEFLWINPDEFKLSQVKDKDGAVIAESLSGARIVGVENTLQGGNRALGTAVALATGHVLVTGGATGDASAVSTQAALTLWNPF